LFLLPYVGEIKIISFHCRSQAEGLIKVTGSHVRLTSSNFLEMAQRILCYYIGAYR